VTQAVAEAKAEAYSVLGTTIESWRHDFEAVRAQLEQQTKRIMGLEQTVTEAVPGKLYAMERPGSASTQSTRTFESLEADGSQAQRSSWSIGATSPSSGARGEAHLQVQRLGEAVRQLEVKVSKLIAGADRQAELPHALGLLRSDLDGLRVKFQLMSGKWETSLQTVSDMDGVVQDNRELRRGFEDVVKNIGFHAAALEHLEAKQEVFSQAFHEKLSNFIGKLDVKCARGVAVQPPPDSSRGGFHVARAASVPPVQCLPQRQVGTGSLAVPPGRGAPVPSGVAASAVGRSLSPKRKQKSVGGMRSAQPQSPYPAGVESGFPLKEASRDDQIVSPLMQAIEALRDENLRLRKANLEKRTVAMPNEPEEQQLQLQQQQQQQQQQQYQPRSEQQGSEKILTRSARVDSVEALTRSVPAHGWQHQQTQQPFQREPSQPRHEHKQTQNHVPMWQQSVPEDQVLAGPSAVAPESVMRHLPVGGHHPESSPKTPNHFHSQPTPGATTHNNSAISSNLAATNATGPATTSFGGAMHCGVRRGRKSNGNIIQAPSAQQQELHSIGRRVSTSSAAPSTAGVSPFQQLRGSTRRYTVSDCQNTRGVGGGMAIDRTM